MDDDMIESADFGYFELARRLWEESLDTWQRLGVTRYPAFAMLERVWELRDNVSAYDATYVALAELLGCALVTADGRLAGAPNLRCSVTVVPADSHRP